MIGTRNTSTDMLKNVRISVYCLLRYLPLVIFYKTCQTFNTFLWSLIELILFLKKFSVVLLAIEKYCITFRNVFFFGMGWKWGCKDQS